MAGLKESVIANSILGIEDEPWPPVAVFVDDVECIFTVFVRYDPCFMSVKAVAVQIGIIWQLVSDPSFFSDLPPLYEAVEP